MAKLALNIAADIARLEHFAIDQLREEWRRLRHLAGTIKKKLGLALTSSKTAGELSRYCIDTKRCR